MAVELQRERIVDAARRLFAEPRGDRNRTMERIADAAGVSRATVYRYFPSKTALLRAFAPSEGAARTPLDPRAQVLEAALAVFAERGIHGATLREIAERAGLSLSGLHWHFKNKDDLVSGLFEYLPVLPALAAEAAQASSADLHSQLTNIAQVVLRTMHRRRALLRLALCEAAVYPDVARIASTHTLGRALPLLAGVFEQHQRRGTVRPGPARIRAQAFMSMLAMLVLLRPIFDQLLAADDQECAREYVEIILRGVLALPEHAAATERAILRQAQDERIGNQSRDGQMGRRARGERGRQGQAGSGGGG